MLTAARAIQSRKRPSSPPKAPGAGTLERLSITRFFPVVSEARYEHFFRLCVNFEIEDALSALLKKAIFLDLIIDVGALESF